MSDAEGEDWEETSQPWAGPCEGKCVGFEQLLQGLCVDVQAAVMAAGPSYPVSLFSDVEERLLRSQPPSQECLTPSDTALLRGAFPQLLHNFSEADAVRLMLLGVRDSEAVGCMVHGVKRESAASASGQNPVDPVFRMAADMSCCFTLPRSFASAAPSAPAAATCASASSDPAASPFSSAPACFPSSFPPELKTLSAQAVATRIKAIGKAYEQDSQTLVDEGFDGKMIGTFCGRADGNVLQVLETIGIKSQQHRERILVAFKDLFDPQTYPIQVFMRAPFFALRCAAGPCF
jgi:hypothetical protein